ncbi:MAG: sigma-70 family RNA polymerase sigma factor [Vicinamibacterales bacterium]
MTSDTPRPADVTTLLLALRETPDPERVRALMDAVYPELRRVAGGLMRRERSDHTLQPTALVHEAYLSLVDHSRLDWQSRAHFFGAAANAMRRILVDHARARAAQKRGGAQALVTFDEGLGHGAAMDVSLLDLHDALERFAALDPRAAEIVELRVFGGLTVPEVAEVLHVSKRTVDNDWAMARMWLARELRTPR